MSNLAGSSDSVVQTFYVPGKEADILSAFESLTPNAASDKARIPGSPIDSTISLSTQGDNTVIYYDHWEDGLEVDLNNPTQSSTEIWGDNDPSNGIAPGSATDILSAGEAIALNNEVPVLPERDSSEILYDGGDKVGASEVIVTTRTAWANKSGTLLAGAWEVFDTSKFGTSFIFPIGENVDSGTSQIFEYVGLTVTASENGTVLNIDADGDGNQDVDVVLNEGESHFVDGGINAGGTLTADKPVQSHLVSGNISASPDASGSRTYYASRWFTLYPDAQWSNSYYTPVGDTVKNQTNVFVHNPNDNAISVNYEYRDSNNDLVTKSFDIEAGEVYLHELESTSGYHFYTDDLKDIFAASSTVSSGNIRRQGNNATYDWGHNVISEGNLTPVVAMGWAPGSDDRNNDDAPDENSSPVWVTTTDNTRVYVNYSGDKSQGALIDPSGDRYDVHFDVDRLESLKIYDESDRDMSRARIYTTDGTNISAAWGQDPDTASGGFPAIDVGTAILPLPISTAAKTVELVVDNENPDIVDPGDVLEYTVEIRNDGLTPLNDINVSDALPEGVEYVPNTSSINGEPLADNPLGTAFPLDDDGVDNGIDSGIEIGDVPVGETAEVTYQVSIDDPYKGSLLGVFNEVNISSDNGFIDATLRTPIDVPVKTKTLYLSDTQDLDRIDPVESGDTTTAETATVREESYLDRFDGEGYDSNNGSLDWDGDWFESGDNGVVDSGDVRIRRSAIRFDHDDDTPPSIARKVDLSGVSSAVFSFDFSTTKSVDTTDNMVVEASSDGGETFTILETLAGEFINSTAREYNLEEFIDLTADTVVRFRVPEQTGEYPNYAGRSEFFDLDSVKITTGSQVDFQQEISFADDFVLFEGFNISVTTYLDLSNGVLNTDNPGNNDILAKLTYDSGEVADFGKPVLVNTVGDNIYEVSWEAKIAGDSVIPQGESFNLEIANEQNNLDFKVLYDSAEYPSEVDIRTPSLIQVATVEVYDASETGSVVETIDNIDTNYIRVAVTDPFGDYDIRNLDLNITDAEGNSVVTETLDDSFLVNETPGDNLKTYEYPWNPGRDAALGDYQIEVTAYEGLETGLEAVSYTDSASIKIQNGIIPDLVIGDAEVVEGEQLVFDFSLSDAIEVDIVLDLAATDDTANNSLDYDFDSLEYSTDGGETWLEPEGELGTVVTIPAGNSDIQVRVNSTEDEISELNENFGLGVANVVSGRIGDISDVGLGTIQDNDPLPTISIDNVSLEEGDQGGKEFNFNVNLTNPSSQTITVDYATGDDTATVENNDYFAEAGTLSFAPGETSQTITVIVNGDTSVELATGIIESFTLDLANAINATVDEEKSQGIGDIIDDDAVARFAIDDVTQTETDGGTTPFVFTVTRSEEITKATTIDYAIVDGTADSEDYLATNGTISFEPGVTEQEIVVEVAGDPLPEGDDTFTVTLSNPAADGAIDDPEGVGTITNDDFYGEVTGQVFADIDDDDVGDNLLGGVVIRLKDTEGNVVQETTTGLADENGNYRFSDVLPGNYTVVQENLDDSYSDVTPNSIPVNVLPQETSDDNNFVDEQLGSISGSVLADIDNDDIGDRPLAEAVVTLEDAEGNIIATKTTAAREGSYEFTDVPAGDYVVTQTNLDDTYSDVTPNTTQVTLAAGANSAGNNFVDEQLGSISGSVLADIDNDDIGDSPLGEVTLTLKDAEDNELATTITDEDGSYSFADVPAGDYVVTQTNLDNTYSNVSPNNVRVSLAAGATVSNTDFVDEQLGSISGSVLADIDNDDAGDNPLAEVTIELQDAAGNVVATTTTAEDGSYSLVDIPAGSYTVVQTNLDNTYSDVSPNAIEVTLAAGASLIDNNFVDEQLGSISGNVLADIDNDDAGDNPLAEVAVTLEDAEGNVIATTTTGEDGSYSFVDVPAGDYVVTQTNLDDSYSDVTPNAIEVTLAAGASLVDNNFVDEQLGSIEGMVLADLNNDDSGDSPLVEVTLTLKDAEGNELATTITGEDGSYSFADIPAGDYVVTQTNLDDTYSDVSPRNIEISLDAGASFSNVDFVDEQLGSISGSVLADIDNDDAGDDPLAGVTVELLDSEGELVASVASDENGFYSFDNIPAGSYQVVQTNLDESFSDVTDNTIELTLAAGAESTGNDFADEQLGGISGSVLADLNNDDLGDAPISGVEVTLENEAGDTVETIVTDDNGAYNFTNVPAGNYSVIQTNLDQTYTDVSGNKIDVTLAAGAKVENESFVDEQLGSISGSVLADIDNDDAGDNPLAEVTIELQNATGNVVATTTTAEDGSYSLVDIPAGYYTVVQTNLNNTYSDVSPNAIEVTLAAGASLIDNNFVDEQLGSISGNVLADIDNDDAGDDPLAEVAVTLEDAEGNIIATTTTSEDGSYSFANIPAGDYVVAQTNLDDSYSDVTPNAIEVTLAAGASLVDNNFVDEQLGSIEGMVLADLNNDDIGDSPLGEVTLTLKDAEDNELATTITDEDGSYSFADVPAGDYVVTQTNLDNTYSNVSPNNVRVSLAAGATVSNTDFVDEQLGSISGSVLADIDNDDAGDNPLAEVTVELQDAAGNVVATTTTAEDGSYSLADIPAGSYTVVQTNLDNTYSDVTPNAIELTLAAGAESIANDFIDEQLGGISGKVRVDTDYDGTGDRPIADVSLSLQDLEGNLLATTTTNLEGSYTFAGLAAGSYNVIQTNLNDSYLDVRDSDGENPNNIEVVLGSGEFAENNNFIDEQVGAISGTDDADTIDGTNDDDTIVGYGGEDTLRGGEGNDTFVFKTITDGVDLITDFTPGQDRLDISEILANDLNYTGEDPVADGHVLFKDCFGGTMLQIDPDGDGELPAENVAFVYGASSENANLMFGNENGEDFAPTAPPEMFYFSLQENTFDLAGNTYRDEDIIKFDGEEFTTFFDGSDVQVSGLDLDAFDIISESEILLSFSTPKTLVVDGEDVEVDDSDIVKFIGSQMGSDTEGSYEMFFDGSEYGLNAALEDIDGIQLLDEENLLISTIGSSDNIIAGSLVTDEDILQVDLSAADRADAWSIYMDGSDIGLDDNDNEDVSAITLNSQNDVFVSTIGDSTVPDRAGNEVAANNVSALEFNPTYLGSNTSGSFDRTPIFDGNNFGLDAENINAMSIELVAAEI